MSLSLTPSAHRQYLRHCMRVSVVKRRPIVAAAGALACVLSVGLGASVVEAATMTTAALLVSAGGIALDSWRRHWHDV